MDESRRSGNTDRTSQSPTAGDIDPATFREIMASFPTGVTVITTCDESGEFKGFTSNAVASVSLDPPLLLVCIGLTSETLPLLRQARRFVVNFLKSGEHEISTRFARKGPSKFDGISVGVKDGMPVLFDHVIAHAVCTTEAEVEAGDHIVLIARVYDGDVLPEGCQPLLYYRSEYPSWPAP